MYLAKVLKLQSIQKRFRWVGLLKIAEIAKCNFPLTLQNKNRGNEEGRKESCPVVLSPVKSSSEKLAGSVLGKCQRKKTCF